MADLRGNKLDPKNNMVFFDSDPVEVGTKVAAEEEEPASFAFSCLTPKRWKKGGKDNNELEDIVDERLDKNAKASTEEEEEREAKDTCERAEIEPTSEKTQDKEVEPVVEGTKGGQAVTFTAAEEEGATVVASSSSLEMPAEEENVAGKSLLKLSKTKAKKTKPKPQTPKRALIDDIGDDESEASIEVLFRYMGCTQEAYGERYQNPTISATLTMETTGTYETSGDDDNDLIENIETIESADNNDDASDGDANDDDANDDDGTDIESDDDIGNDVLSSPSGNLLMEDIDDENSNDKADELMEIANKALNAPDDQPNTTPDQPDDTTPPDKQSDDTTPFDERIVENHPSDEQIDKSAPIEGQAKENTHDNAPTDAQLDGKDEHIVAVEKSVIEEQPSSAEAKPTITRLTVNTNTYVSEEDTRSPAHARSAAMDKVATMMSHSALSPSVRKIALALQNAPKYPTTDYSDENESDDNQNACTVQDNHTDKEDMAEDIPVEKQKEKAKDLVKTVSASATMSKVEEMDKLIKSTRAWLETQKAERKVAEKVQVAEVKVTDSITSRAMSHMDKITAKAISPKNSAEVKKLDTSLPEVNIASEAMSPKNTTKTALPEMKIDTSLPVIKSPTSTKTPSSKAQPLSPRTLDNLLSSRNTDSSDGPKKSILEQLEEIRTKQREREAISPRSP